ncbi:MAG: Fe-S-containing protein [Solidesulfovibrio sp. DCME]|uniref:Fe-S-containing protein n=1 Tax=Solidesulfovibrio sp. DCME TaxID=3447380 RepID=UPI003D0A2CC2
MRHPVRARFLAPALVAACLGLAALCSLPDPASALLGIFSDTKTLSPQGDAVTIPLADVSDGKAHFYAVTAGGKEVRFFAVKSADGKVRTAFDACDVCFPEKKGYRQEGEFMVCVNCGRRFHGSKVGEVHGGCNPAPLAAEVTGDSLRVPMAALTAGASYF